MKTKIIIFYLITALSISFAQTPVAQWSFDDPTDLTKADIGNALMLVGVDSAVTGPVDGDGAVSIGIGSYYVANPNMSASGADTAKNVNIYSIAYDFKVLNLDNWHSFMQTDPENLNDGDFFVHPDNGIIGVRDAGYTNQGVKINQWYRLVIVVNLADTSTNAVTYYIDGVKQTVDQVRHQQIDNRFSFGDINQPIQLLLFADESQEDDIIEIAKVSIFDKALTDAEVTALGGYDNVRVGVDEDSYTPEVYTLNQNYPNPFNPSTIISYSIPKQSMVTLKVYNLLGELVSTLVDQPQSAGKYEFQFNAGHLSSGIYFYTIKAGKFTKAAKMMLLK